MVQALAERPPYVTFETRAVENRAASIESGHYVGDDVDYVFITPAGSKDRIEREVKGWFEKLAEDQAQQRIPPTWVEHFKGQYASFKAGQAAPINGFPIRDWPGLSPAQAKTLQGIHILSVEDLASANEETIGRIGMGGRALKQRALDFLRTADNVGKVAEESSALRQENVELKSQVAALTEATKMLQAQMSALQQNGGFQSQPSARPASETISSSDFLDGAEPL